MTLETARRLRPFAICLSLLLTGCGGTDFGPTGSIDGRLTLDGKPMAEGTQLLFMQMEKGYAAFGHTDGEGNYEITWMREGSSRSEVPVGSYKVLIQPPEVKKVEELSPEEMLDGKDADIPPPEANFPTRYRQHSTSGLEYDIKEGENTVDIDLKSDAT